ncbi:hypothetical protein CBR_g19160 [Chara braunii]|uniref:Uncharacterized protein n=1 Tax=Chara braunii TaxID=69332 RepID=A0A388JTE2_CHABU|nr:hypothetical protein CBR_g19160 [Chara braunii]|eukprot:GBG61084.1 hypothetical protein CBR_g19160 [Chara braunii]
MEWYRRKAAFTMDNTMASGELRGMGSATGEAGSEGGGTETSGGTPKTRRTNSGKVRGSDVGQGVSAMAAAMEDTSRRLCEGLDTVAGTLASATTEGAALMAARLGDMATEIGHVAGAMRQGNSVLDERDRWFNRPLDAFGREITKKSYRFYDVDVNGRAVVDIDAALGFRRRSLSHVLLWVKKTGNFVPEEHTSMPDIIGDIVERFLDNLASEHASSLDMGAFYYMWHPVRDLLRSLRLDVVFPFVLRVHADAALSGASTMLLSAFWVGGLHTSGCGAVVFLSDDNGGSWYCCGGVEKSEAGRTNYDGRKFRTFFLTSVYDGEGKNWVKEDKKVSLDLRLFQGYGVKALSMKAFDVRGNATEFQMLDPEKFLSKTNGYRVTGSLPVVDNTFLLSKPLVQFNSPTDQLAPTVMRYREQFARLPAAQQVDCVFLPFDAGSKPEQSSEATDYDGRALRHLAGPQHRSREGTSTFDNDDSAGQEGEGGGEEGDDGDEQDADGEDNGIDDERDVGGEGFDDTRSSQCGRPRNENDSRACRGVDAYGGAVADGAGDQPPEGCRSRITRQGMEETKMPHGERGKGEKRQPLLRVNRNRRGLTLSTRLRARTHELWDSGDEGEGVGPRMPEDVDDLVQHAAPLDTTRCFFLEYDDQGFARQDVRVVNVDVTRIKRIPRGPILYNHRSLSDNIVRGIVNAIESSITVEPGAWDRPDLVLAPVDPNVVIDGQGRRITPDEFFQRDSAEFDWYAICGQHTAETMKRLVEKDSAAVKVYGLRSYSKVRVVFFDDDHTRGYFNVSAFDNTRENRAMMVSFQDAVRDTRQWWIDNDRIEAPKAKQIPNYSSKLFQTLPSQIDNALKRTEVVLTMH